MLSLSLTVRPPALWLLLVPLSSSAATLRWLLVNQGHRSIDLNLPYSDLSFFWPKNASKPTNLSFQIQFSKNKNILFSVFGLFRYEFERVSEGLWVFLEGV